MQFNFKIKYLIIILLLMLGYFFLLTQGIPENRTLCIFKNITGVPCPACGSTRATVLLFHGHLLNSLLLNPLGLLTNVFILISIIWMVCDIVRDRETFLPFLKTDWNNSVKAAVFIVLVANWIWNITKGL